MNIFKKRIQKPYVPYQVVPMPGNYHTISEILLELLHKDYEPIHSNTDDSFFIFQHKELSTMEQNNIDTEQEHYKVISLPTSVDKIAIVLNEGFAQGYRVVVMNDYSCVMELMK